VLLCVVNVPLQPARVPRTPCPDRVLAWRSFTRLAPILEGSVFCEEPLPCPACPDPQAELQGDQLTCGVPRAFRLSFFDFHFSIFPFPISFLLTCLRTLVPASPLFSHTSLKHPGVVGTPSNSRLLYNLRTLYLASFAPTPYRWPIAFRFSRCHNPHLGQLLAGRALRTRCFLEGGTPGAETFRRLVVSNTLSGRGLGLLLPIRSAKRPDAGKWFMGRPLWPRPAWASSPSRACSLKTV
jgi:hypothetical protein